MIQPKREETEYWRKDREIWNALDKYFKDKGKNIQKVPLRDVFRAQEELAYELNVYQRREMNR